jgi:hypothetical protein
MKTSELTGAALDWAVAKCKGELEYWPEIEYSTDWAQGGPIIAREGISVTQFKQGEVDACDVNMWCAAYNRDDFGDDTLSCTAPTFLIAAMRCFVASKLGDNIEIPEELNV